MNRPIITDPDLGSVSPADLRKQFPDFDVRAPDDVVSELEETSDPTVLVTSNSTWNDAYLDGISAGDWVTTIGVGYDTFPLEALSAAGVVFTNSPGINAEQVAEHVFGMACYVTRQLRAYRAQQREHSWVKHRHRMTDLSGDTCCVLGLGNVGEAVAKRAKAFGMNVRGVKQRRGSYDGSADVVYHPDTICDALSGSRLLVIAVPLTEETRGMIDRDELDALSDDAIVVNVARGPILVTTALLSALREHTLMAACLDVTDPEPLSESHPLWDRDDVLITPHCAGSSEKYANRFLELFGEEYDRWCAGETLSHQIV